MKKVILTIVAIIATALSVKGMSYEQARNEALFLTDKMAYELNLTSDQYEAAYEINLDYLMGVTGRNDVFGTYWERRNLDMSYILLDWQWSAFRAASYFFRPLYWEAGYWHFGVYARYPRRHYLYFGRPAFYSSYRGGHSWHAHGGKGYYHGRRNHYVAGSRNHSGMRDRWSKGDFRKGPSHGKGSSTRVTVDRHGSRDNRHHSTLNNNRPSRDNKHNSSFGSHRGNRQNADKGTQTVDRGNRSSVDRGNSNSVDRGNRSSVDRGNRSSVSRQDRGSASTRSKAGGSEQRSSSSNGGGRFGGGR